MNYRRPVVYIPPYNYCDRWCDGCAIDKSRCLLYQTEMDERLHREIDGLGAPTPEEMIGRIVEDARKALRMVEDQVREMGMDPRVLQRESESAAPRRKSEDPMVAEAALLARGIAAFLRQHGKAHPRESELLRRSLALPAPKLGRATLEPEDEMEEADGILQAQVAHRALAVMAEALEAIRRRDPSLGDAMLDLLALLQRLAADIRERWLTKPCELLEPVDDDCWWGPVRDITPTLRHFRR
ncbi:MAG TPA: hypothetical protein VG457_16820 [Planctomycetota bacterium]|jgi:hypothetical protein|nr:hypothetical protein [Planctomycetota bacterium]